MDFGGQPGGKFLSLSQAGSTVTASASPHTKGSYTELVTSTPEDYDALLFTFNINSDNVRMLIDLAFGGAGSEVVVVSNYLLAQQHRINQHLLIPFPVAAGTRVAARCQATTGGVATAVYVAGIRGSFFSGKSGGSIATLGVDTATTEGTSIDPGATLSTYGSWVQLTASTSKDITGLFPVLSNKSNTAPQNLSASFMLDIGVGGSGSEVAVISGMRFGSSDDASYGPLPTPLWMPVYIPAGSRIAARAQAGTTDATDRLFALGLYTLSA